jgi:predicted transcriptional regulator
MQEHNHHHRRQRDRYDIVRNILTIISNTRPLYRNQMNKTRIGYAAGLTHTQTVEYLKALINLGLINKMEFQPFFSYHEITERGRRCLQLLADSEDDLRPERMDLST